MTDKPAIGPKGLNNFTITNFVVQILFLDINCKSPV